MDFSPQELGYAPTPPPPPGTMPPGDGRAAVPSFMSFSALISTAARTFRYTFDEALRAGRTNALAMERDPVIKGALRGRMMPTAQLPWDITPRDETNPAEVDAAKVLKQVVEDIPNLQAMWMMLLRALWYGRYGVQVEYAWDITPSTRRLRVRDFQPVNGDKLRFKWDGTVGVMVQATYPGTWESTDLGAAHFLTPAERRQFVVHRVERHDADYFEPELAGGINGVGIRGDLYYFWWLKTNVMALLLNYLERFSNGLTIFYYDAMNPEAKAEAEAAARQQFSNVALIYPRWPDGKDTNGVQRLEVGTASAGLLESLTTGYFDNVMKLYIRGQILTSETAATGLGSGVAEQHGETEDTIVKYDATNLQATVQSDLIDVLSAYNCPGVPVPRFKFLIDRPNAQEVMGNAMSMFQMGFDVDGDPLYEVCGLNKPQAGGQIAGKVAPLQPTAVEGAPAGVPMAGPAGPVPPGGEQPEAAQAAGPPQPERPVVPSRMSRRGQARVLREFREFVRLKRSGGRGPAA